MPLSGQNVLFDERIVLMSTSADFDVRALVQAVQDTEFTDSTAEVIPLNSPRRKNARGRAAFAEDICSIHGGTLEAPCAKFSALPGDGRGPFIPGKVRKMRVFFIGLIKPVLAISIIGGGIYFGHGFIPSIHGGITSVVPNTPVSPSGAAK